MPQAVRTTLGFGCYRILDRLSKGEPINHHEGTLWTMLGLGLAEPIDGILKITKAGRDYLATHKEPPFPSSSKTSAFPGVVSHLKMELGVERTLWTMLFGKMDDNDFKQKSESTVMTLLDEIDSILDFGGTEVLTVDDRIAKSKQQRARLQEALDKFGPRLDDTHFPKA